MNGIFKRTELLLGEQNLEKLKNFSVAVFGAGGVGGYALEALARCGVGNITVFDNDVISESNINRQIFALSDNIGVKKVDAAKKRLLEINPDLNIITNSVFYLPENADEFDLSEYDYIIDAIDTITAKIELIVRAKKNNIKIISAMGTGNKLCPELFKVGDIFETKVCPLCRVMRKELKDRNIKSLKVVYSEEKPCVPLNRNKDTGQRRKDTPGSVSFVPPVAGMILAGEVIKDLICGR